MKVYVDNKHAQNSIGFFFSALESHLEKFGVLTNQPGRADVILCGPTSVVASKYLGRTAIVQRLDGIYFDSDALQKTTDKNNAINSLYRRADGIIFQSRYSKKMVESIIGKTHKKNIIIHNGTQSKIKYNAQSDRFFPEVAAWKEQGYTILLGAADWRPVKRADTLMEGFSLYRKTHPKTKLLLAGDIKGEAPEGVVQLGRLPHRSLMVLYTMIDLLVNLSFSDACPNVVVEALYSKKPILASSYQGSSEFYGGNGYIIQEPFDWDYRLLSYAKMPSIDPVLVADGIEKALAAGYNKDIDVSISTCAMKYKKFLESVSGLKP